MGNAHVKPHPRPRNKKQVHWKAADRPAAPGKPHLASDNELTPDLVTIRWAKPSRDGGSPITGYLVEHRRTGSPHWVRATPVLVPITELTISGLEPGWRYQFRVSAENAVGLSDPSDTSEPLTVTLQKFAITAPKFTDELKDATVLENDKIEFIVHFLGQPPPKICWFKDGFEIFSSRRTRILTETDRSILTIHQSALADEGEIKCTATNKAGHASTKARLILEAPPTIRLPRQYEDGLLFEIGEVIRLKVSVAGRPTPLIFWSHNGETIQNNDRYEIEYIDKSSILKLGEAQRSDRGEYQIKAVNKIGEDVVSFLVTITDKPSPPGRARVVMTLGRSVTLSWSTPSDDGGCKIGNYIIEYYRLGWNVWLKAATSRQLTTILGDLIEGSEYKFRIKAESPYGVSDPSEESDVVFIPDPKRGITSPQVRSKSQPKDLIEQIVAVPVPMKRRKQTRSQSSTGKSEAINYMEQDEIPKKPERTKVKTPEASPRLKRKDYTGGIHQTIIDRASIARELAYGSPGIKMMKTELDLPTVEKNKTPSRTPSPQNHVEPSKTPSPKDQRKGSLLRETSDNLGGSSEFMLVLYPDASEKDQRWRGIEFDFDEDAIPPPLSLSAPELGVEPPPFNSLKSSASSSELLHERAMIRFHEAAAAEEAADLLNKERRKSSIDATQIIPKIQINSQDDQDIVGLERKHSRRRQSAGSVVQQQVLWAQRRYSLRNSLDLADGKMPKVIKVEEKREQMMLRQRSESEEKEEAEFERVRARMALQGQTSLEKRSIDVVDEDKWMEDYEESLSESSTSSSSEDERIFDQEPTVRNVYSDEDEDTYHPGAAPIKNEEPFEILTKRNKLPDPNFIPKPILKKNEDIIVNEPVTPVKIRSHSPMPKFRQSEEMLNQRQRSFSLAQPILPTSQNKSNTFPGPNQNRQRSFSLTTKPETIAENLDKILETPVAPGHNISAVAQLTGITAASIVIPEGLLRKKKDEEEAKVVVDHYGDIVKNFGQRKSRINTNWRQMEEAAIKKTEEAPQTSFKEERRVSLQKRSPSPELQQRRDSIQKRSPSPEVKQRRDSLQRRSPTPELRQKRDSLTTEDAFKLHQRSPTPERRKSLKTSTSSGRQRRSPTPQRGRVRKRSKTPLENWSDRKVKRPSPSPLKSAPTRPRPMLREIMTQTSIGLELEYSSDSRTSSPNFARQEQLMAEAEVKVKSAVDYATDVAMFIVACWFYFTDNELLAIPVLLIMVYRQLQDGIRRSIPRWIVRRFTKTKTKKKKT